MLSRSSLFSFFEDLLLLLLLLLLLSQNVPNTLFHFLYVVVVVVIVLCNVCLFVFYRNGIHFQSDIHQRCSVIDYEVNYASYVVLSAPSSGDYHHQSVSAERCPVHTKTIHRVARHPPCPGGCRARAIPGGLSWKAMGKDLSCSQSAGPLQVLIPGVKLNSVGPAPLSNIVVLITGLIIMVLALIPVTGK